MCAAAILAAGARAQATGLDPFRPTGAGTGAGPTAPSPFRLAQASGGARPATPPAAAPAPRACTRDEECPSDGICEDGICQAIPQRTNILYLYYRDGSFVESFGLYWSKRGSAGYRVLAPFYWHTWTPTSEARVVAPLFWRFDDYARQHRTTVVVPFSWTSEPGASSWAVWPLFYKSSKYGWAAPLLGTWAIKDPGDRSAFGAALFLYWWKRSETRGDFDLAFPLFVSSRDKDRAFTYAVPLTFYWRHADDATTLSIPFFYRNTHKTGGSFYTWIGYRTREGQDTTGAMFWLYWYGRDDAKKSAYDVFVPLLWSFRGEKESSTVGFPLLWYFRQNDAVDAVFFPLVWSFSNAKESTTLVVPYVHARRDTWTMDGLFPLWWRGGDPKTGDAFHTLLPFFFWNQSGHGRRATLVSLLGGYHRDDDARSKTLALLPGIITHSDPTQDFQIVTPLFIRHHDADSDTTTKLIGPLYLRDDPQGSTSVLFPIVWRLRDAETGATATSVFPLFFYRSGPADTTFAGGVFPLWVYGRKFKAGAGGKDGGWGAGLFPLAFFGRHGDDSHAVVFPLLWHFGHSERDTTVALPLFYTHGDGHGRQSAIFPLLTFFGRDHDESYAVQFPLFWHFANQRQGWSTTVTPIGFFHAARDGWSAGVGPLLPILWLAGGGPRAHAVLFPVFWHFTDERADRSTTVVGPYLHRREGGQATDALFPLIYYRRGARPGGSDETSFTLFPLVHYRRDAGTRLLITPLGGSVKTGARGGGFVGPFFWFENSQMAAKALFPLYADVTRLATSERTRQFGLWFQIDAPEYRSRVLFPLFGHYEDKQETDTYVFPSLFRQRRSDGYHVDTFLPFFWHSGSAGFSTTVIASWYQHTAPGVHDTGLAPLWFYAKNDKRSLTVVPPLLLYRRRGFDDDTSFLWAGPVFHSRQQDVRHRTVVFPLWWSGHESERSHAILLPIFWHVANSKDETSISVLVPFFWSRQGQERTAGILPIVWYTRSTDGKSGGAALLPLFYRSYGPGSSRFLTVLGGFSTTPTSRLWYVGPVASREAVESRFRMVAPFWIRHENKSSETVTQVIPPLLSVSRTNPEGGLTTFLALFWRYTDIASATTVGFPLYYDFHDRHQSRFSIFIPLIARYHRDSDDNTYWIALPLFYRHTTPTDSTTWQFPFWWDFKRGDDTTTVLFPFYAHWKRSGYQSTYVFPTYFYREGLQPDGQTPDGTWMRVVAPFYRSAVYRPGDFMWEVLGGLYGQERIGRKRFLKVFFLRFETEPPSPAKTAWYGQPLRPSRRAPARGLATTAW
ncbi:MAG TPA: hypothetical protein VMU50_11100 [Polyangia bacterium]|nr:hypothetical protein [Polyangia bacterium]